MSPRLALRRRLRAERRKLSMVHRRYAARAVARHHAVHRLLGSRSRIACYLANDGELDPQPLIRWLRRTGRDCYLPVLNRRRGGAMCFAAARANSCMVPNRYGIPEPVVAPRRCLAARDLDLILLPLVGFDERGNRIGMGGGFYDRTLAFLGHRHPWRRPLLIGLAYEFQRLPTIATRAWDIPLDGVITEAGLQRFA